jgi:UDP:flavonoid glycosyltransferase YjiC (YdhE family)
MRRRAERMGGLIREENGVRAAAGILESIAQRARQPRRAMAV